MSATKELHVNVRHEDGSLWATVEEFRRTCYWRQPG